MNANSASSNSTSFDKGQRVKISKIASLITAIRKVDAEMPLGQVMFFIAVAQNEGKSLKEIAELCGLLIPSASRYLASLSYISGYRQSGGVSLVHATEHPLDRRQKVIVLTVAGRKLIEGLIGGI